MESPSVASTDPYPTNYRSFSSSLEDVGVIASQNSCPPATSEEDDRFVSNSGKHTKPPANAPKIKWDKEQFDVRRPYERKEYERPYRTLPGFLAAFEGLNVKPQKCPTANAFARRTPLEEVFHARNVTTVCRLERPRPLEHCVDDVIIADNVGSDASESQEVREEEKEPTETVLREGAMAKECCKTFFRARRALLRSELFEQYFSKHRAPNPHETQSDSSESEEMPDEVQQVSEESQQFGERNTSLLELEQQPTDSACSLGSYKPPEIVHQENKPEVVEAQEQFLERIRERYLLRFDRVQRQLDAAEQERNRRPEPFDAERYEAEYPALDIRNEAKERFRQSLAVRLEELTLLQERPVRRYPQTVRQFAAYKQQLMEEKRKRRDEAILVEEYFRKTGTPKEIPEAKLEVKRYRLAEFVVSSEAESDSEEGREYPTEPLVYHTCMTRDEWGDWMARSVKSEKLKFPKVKVPRVPVLVQKCHESPIRAYIEGRLDGRDVRTSSLNVEATKKNTVEKAQIEQPQPKEIIHSRPTAGRTRPTMRDLLFDPMPEPEPIGFLPYNASLRPYTAIVEERFRIRKRQRKAQRQLRKSRMPWIEELVEEICRRKRT